MRPELSRYKPLPFTSGFRKDFDVHEPIKVALRHYLVIYEPTATIHYANLLESLKLACLVRAISMG